MSIDMECCAAKIAFVVYTKTFWASPDIWRFWSLLRNLIEYLIVITAEVFHGLCHTERILGGWDISVAHNS